MEGGIFFHLSTQLASHMHDYLATNLQVFPSMASVYGGIQWQWGQFFFLMRNFKNVSWQYEQLGALNTSEYEINVTW